jgi:Protein of unknown function (DUF3999)
MNYNVSIFAIFMALAGAAADPEIPYFTNVREIGISAPERQNYFVIDEEIWQHANPDLADLRLYDGNAQVGYAISEQRPGVSSQESEARIVNLGSAAGSSEFDLDVGDIAEYDRVRLRLDAKNFVATAFVSGSNSLADRHGTELGSSSLYDFTREALGSNSVLKLPTTSFRYLHVRVVPGANVPAKDIKAAAVYNLREQKAKWTSFGSCGAPHQQKHSTVIECEIPPHVPLDRIEFQIAPQQVNFRRVGSIENTKGQQIAAGEITRVRITRGGTSVTSEELAINISDKPEEHFEIIVQNADNPPLNITRVQPLSIERRVYFDPSGKTSAKLYYGDPKLPAPVYDYTKFFRADPAATQAELGPGMHNTAYTGRPDDRPWSERHRALLWIAMLLAVVVLAVLAVRGFKSETVNAS